MSVKDRLSELGVDVSTAPMPAANYVPYVKTGNLVFISGQLPIKNGVVTCLGKVGLDVDVNDAVKAARLCCINILAQLNCACDFDLDKVVRCVKLGVFVNSGDDFNIQPLVANGASDFMIEVFGRKGQHARFAVSANSLPRGAAVEIDAVFEVE
jgi:enamine deaminase RidA (YjgF/YER057c/UK114 family)